MPAREVAILRRRLAAARRRKKPQDQALAARTLAGEIRNAHRQALERRDALAAALHQQHGVTVTTLANLIYRDTRKVATNDHRGWRMTGSRRGDRVKESIASVTDVPAVTDPAAGKDELVAVQDLVEQLWHLLTQARELADAADAAAPQDGGQPPATLVLRELPADPRERSRERNRRWAQCGAELQQAVHDRNLAAAVMVEHHGWSLPQAQKTAQTSPTRIHDARPDARLVSPASAEADAHRLARAVALVNDLRALREALKAEREQRSAELKAGREKRAAA